MKAKNALLICASIAFYAYGEPVYVVLMLISSLVNWGFGLLLGAGAGAEADGGTGAGAKAGRDAQEGTGDDAKSAAAAKARVQRRRKALVAGAIVANLGFLVVFKYAGMLAASIGALIGDEAPFAGLALPIGISFYTFQALSYVIDVYRGETPPQKSFFRVLLFISFFPQLIAGPIIKYHDVEEQLAERKITIDGVARGLRRFSVGLAKKILIANTFGSIADAVFAAPQTEINIAVAWIGALAYLIQIYFDFSGYSDMAIGLARMFGFVYRENFDYPYISRNIREFWRRWHISLSTWFKEYLYIPLGGNRKGRGRAVLNKLIVFGLCGLWHGASWTFVVWGLFHGIFLLLEEYLPIRRLPRALGWVYTLLVVCVGFVLFRSETFSQALFMLGQMFAGFHFEHMAVARASWMLDPLTIFLFVVAIIAATPIAHVVARALTRNGSDGAEIAAADEANTAAAVDKDETADAADPSAAADAADAAAAAGTIAAANTAETAAVAGRGKSNIIFRLIRTMSYVGALGLFVLCLLALSGGGYNPFIYFRF